MPDRPLILASSSPFRRALLERLGRDFQVIAPQVDETALPGEDAPALVERLAIAKARRVAAGRTAALVIGSDQAVIHDGKIVGKPGDHRGAARQLRAASGQCICHYTGLALIDAASGRTQSEVVPYHVQFRELSEGQIQRYLEREQPYGCAGSLRADGLGIALLERFAGEDPNALIGLPLIRLIRMLEAEGVAVI